MKYKIAVCLSSVRRRFALRLLGRWISFWIKRTESFLISRLQQSVYRLAVRCGRARRRHLPARAVPSSINAAVWHHAHTLQILSFGWKSLNESSSSQVRRPVSHQNCWEWGPTQFFRKHLRENRKAFLLLIKHFSTAT